MRINLQFLLYIIFCIFLICIFIYKAYSPIVTSPDGLRKDELMMYWTYGNEIVKRNFLSFHQLGLWDNQVGLGYPLMGHLSSTFYPVTLLTYFIPDLKITTRFLMISHLIFGGIACFYLLKTLKCNNISATFGSIVYVVNTYVTTILLSGFPSEIYNLVWTSLSVSFLWKSLETGKKWYATLAGICVAMNIFAMMLYSVYYNVLLLLLVAFSFSLFNFFVRKPEKIPWQRIGKVLSILFLVAFSLSSIKLLPIIEYTKYSIRQHVPLYGGIEGRRLGQWDIATLESNFKYLTNAIIPPNSYPSTYIPVSIIFFILILLSFFKKGREVFVFILVTITSLIAAMGKNSFIDFYALFYYIFPPLQSQYYPNRFYIVTNLTIPILASFGIMVIYNFLSKKSLLHAKIATVIISASVVILLTTFTYNQMLHLYKMQFNNNKTITDNRINQSAGLLNKKSKEVIHFASMNKYVWDYTAFVNNFKLVNPMHRDFSLSYQDFPFYYTKLDKEQLGKKYKLLQIMNTKYIVTQTDLDDYPNEYIKPIIKEKDWTIYELNTYFPYITIPSYSLLLAGKNDHKDFNSFKAKILLLSGNFDLSMFSIVTTTQEKIDDFTEEEIRKFDGLILYDIPRELSEKSKIALNNFKSNGGKILNIVFYTRFFDDVRNRNKSFFSENPAVILPSYSENEFLAFLSQFPANKNSHVSIHLEKNTPEDIVFTLNSNKEKNFIQIADTYFPGWQATVDGKDTKVYMADGLVKGIPVEGKGHHKISLQYKPKSFFIGLIISVISAIIILVSLVFTITRRYGFTLYNMRNW